MRWGPFVKDTECSEFKANQNSGFGFSWRENKTESVTLASRQSALADVKNKRSLD